MVCKTAPVYLSNFRMIAQVMSKPFILRVSESVLDAELRREQRETTSHEMSANASEAGLDATDHGESG